MAEVVHGRQMVFPQVVQYAQQDLLLEGTQGFGAGLFFLLVVGRQQLFHQLRAKGFFVQVIVFVEPLLNRQLDAKITGQGRFQASHVPLLGQRLRRDVLGNGGVEHFLAEFGDGVANVVGCQQAVTHVVDDFTLLVGDVVELQQLFTNVEVATFDLALGFLDGVGDHAVLDGLAGLHAQGLHEVLHPVRGEDAHQAVFQRQVETAGARVALTAGTTAQLVVDTTRFVTLGGDHVQATGLDHLLVTLLPVGLDLGDLLRRRVLHGSDFDFPVTAQEDVGTTTGHVGSNGQCPRTTGLGDDLGFFFVVLGVQYLVIDAFLLQQVGHVLGRFDGGGTHQHRTAQGHAFLDVGDDRGVLLVGGQVDQVVEVLTRQRLVRRDDHNVEVIDLGELEGFGVSGTGHAGQLVVQTEVVLEGGRRQGLAFGLDIQVFLRFDGLVQAFGQTATGHGTTGVLVDQQDLAVLDDVLDVAVEQLVRAQAGVNVGQQAQVVRRVEALAFGQQADLGKHLFDELVTGFVELDLAALLVDLVVALLGHLAFHFLDVLLEARDQLVDLDVQLGAVFGLAGDDQRSPRFVDQDGVDFVDHGEIQLTLEFLFHAERHVVAQVVETEFVVGAVGDIGSIGRALFFRRLERRDNADRQAEEFIQRTHPVGVTAGQVVVDRDHVHTLAGQCIEVHAQGCDQGLAFTGTHFCDHAFVQGHAADQLHIKVTHAHDPLARFTGYRKGFRQQLVEGFAFGQALFERSGLGPQLLVGESHHLLFEGIDDLYRLEHAFDFTLVLASKKFF
ncbi:hypothetical protein D3C77_67210 [compost metagenome]